MEDFIDYQKFPNLEDASTLIDLLDANQIPFKIDDSGIRFSVDSRNKNVLEDGVIVQIRQSDKAKADQLDLTITETAINNGHFMYTLSDNDIIDVIVNPEDWKEGEIKLAKEIAEERELKPTAELITSLRKEKRREETEKNQKQTKIISNGASWFLWIAILSSLNIVALLFKQNVNFVIGLGTNYVIIGIIDAIRRITGTNFMALGIILSFLISGLFILIWNKSKKGNHKVYLIGMIWYTLDTLIFLISKEWYSIGFHIFALLGLYGGYKALLTKRKETKNTEKN